jgi:hypothetical protein
MLQPIPKRPWGWVTAMARACNVSRTTLYEWRDRAQAAISAALAPQQPGLPPQSHELVVDRAVIQRAIATLPMLTGSVRGIQLGLELLFGVHRSVGYISQTLQAAGAAAADCNASLIVPLPVLGEADEIFQGQQPCLTVVDGRSFLVLNLTPAAARDGTTWGCTFLDLQARGVQFHDLVCDGARGIQAGVQEAQLGVPVGHDLFHLLREAHRLTQRLERAAYRALATAERARRAAREAQAPKRRPGRPLTVKVPLVQAEQQEEQAITTYDLWVWLLGEIRQALEPVTPTGQVNTVAAAKETVETAIELLQELHHDQITAVAQQLQQHLADLLAPLFWLARNLAPWQQEVDPATEATIVWAWRHRQALDLQVDDGFPAPLRPVVRAFWRALDLFHRASSLAESLHSWLRPHLQIHRGMPQWLLPLLQLFWNHHSFTRGKRAGQSPLELAGVSDALSLSAALDQLFQPQPVAQAA